MELLFEIDLRDYELGDNVFSRPSARGIIFDDCGRIALVYSTKEEYYKFPGGGILAGEDKKEALIREVREETGLVVIPKSVREFGSVLRRQKSNKTPNTIEVHMTTFYFVRHGHMDTSMAGKKFYKDFSYNMMTLSKKGIG